MDQCQYKIRWTFNTVARCERDHHIDRVEITPAPGGKYQVTIIGDGKPDTPTHRAHVGERPTLLTWQAGDRREYTGDWPGQCSYRDQRGQCVLHAGHYGNHAP